MINYFFSRISILHINLNDVTYLLDFFFNQIYPSGKSKSAVLAGRVET